MVVVEDGDSGSWEEWVLVAVVVKKWKRRVWWCDLDGEGVAGFNSVGFFGGRETGWASGSIGEFSGAPPPTPRRGTRNLIVSMGRQQPYVYPIIRIRISR